MKTTAKSTLCLVLLTLFAVLSASAGKQPFSLIIVAPTEPLKLGAELRLRVTVTNTSQRTIAFIRSPGTIPEEAFRYEIDVRDAKGLPAPPSAYLRELRGQKTATFESRYALWLKPGESFIDEVNVTKFYDLSQPGQYTISVARGMPPRQNLGTSIVKSNVITVIVRK